MRNRRKITITEENIELKEEELEKEEIFDESWKEQQKSKFFTRLALWLAILYSSLFEFSGALISSLIVMIAISANFLVLDSEGSFDENSPQAIIVILIVNLLASLIVGSLAFLYCKKVRFIPPKQEFRMTKKDWKVILICFSFMFFLVGGVDFLTEIIRLQFFPEFDVETPYDFLMSKNISVIIFSIVIISFVAPVIEEIFYRWTMISTLRNGMNRWATICFSSLIFSMAHSSTNLAFSFYYFVFHLISTFMMGAIIASAFIETGKLIVAIILHAGWNLALSSSFLFNLAGISEGFTIVYLMLICLGFIGVTITTALYVRKRRKRLQDQRKIEMIDNDSNEEGANAERAGKKIAKEKIKLRGEWFYLILGYFFSIVLMPTLIILLEPLIGIGEGIIVIVYLGLLTIIAFLVISKKQKFFLDFYHK